MTAYEKVMAARDANKLTSVDYIAHMFGDSFIELHGDPDKQYCRIYHTRAAFQCVLQGE